MLYEMREFFGRERECDLGMGWEWEWNSTILGMGMGIARWEWEGTGIKNPFPNTSSYSPPLVNLYCLVTERYTCLWTTYQEFQRDRERLKPATSWSGFRHQIHTAKSSRWCTQSNNDLKAYFDLYVVFHCRRTSEATTPSTGITSNIILTVSICINKNIYG